MFIAKDDYFTEEEYHIINDLIVKELNNINEQENKDESYFDKLLTIKVRIGRHLRG